MPQFRRAPAAHAAEVQPPNSGDKGRPIDELFARVERAHPGIEDEIGLSSAALRAGRMVRDLRKSRGLTQKQLADSLGWDQERISNIERGEGVRGPSYDVMQKIADACEHDLQFCPRAVGAVEIKPVEEPVPVGEVLDLDELIATPDRNYR